jgi:hypothetical protein
MTDEVAQVQAGMSMGGLSRVDSSLIPKSRVGTDVFQNIRLLRTSTDVVKGDQGSRKVTFSPPNSGLLNLRDLSIFCDMTLDGGVAQNAQFPFIPNNGRVWKWDGSGSDPEPSLPPDTTSNTVATTNIRPGLSDKFFASLIERIVVSTGSTPFIDVRELNVINHLNMKQRWNSIFLVPSTTTYQGYDADNSNRIPGIANSGYWENVERLVEVKNTRYYYLQSNPQQIQIKPFLFENALFNTSDGILPLQMMPNVTIDIYFAGSESVLQQALPVGYRYYQDSTAITGRINYILQNLKMECLMAGSNSLETQLIEQGMSMTISDFAHHTRQLKSVKGTQSFQVPITQRAVEEVYVILRQDSLLKDITASGKLSAYWPGQRFLLKANIRINGIRRYGEDLDSREMKTEFERLNPETRMSELFQDEWRDWNNSNQIIVFSSKMDYSKELLSGIKTASQTSPLIIDIQWLEDFNPSEVPLVMDIFVKYGRWISISREQIEVVD